MKILERMLIVLVTLALISLPLSRAEAAVTYVTDAGGYAYDESRAVTNLAPAIALGTVVIVAIIAVAVQNSHSSSSSYSSHYSSYSSHFSSSSSSSSSSSGS